MPEWPRRISEELRQHLDDEYDALRAGGLGHDEAMRRLAGDVDELASMRARPIDAVTTDIRFALRTLRKNPGFTAIVMVTLALGIGATAAIFTLVDAVMLRPYPYADMDRIVMVAETTRAGQNPIRLVSGEERRFLEDGDELILSARTPPSQKFAQMGFGECCGSVHAAARRNPL